MGSVEKRTHDQMKTLLSGAVMAVVISLAACAPQSTPQPSPTAVVVTETSAATLTEEPNLAPTETVLPSATATLAETALPTETLIPTMDYAAIEIKGLTSSVNGVDVVALVPGIQGAYQLELGGIPYQCATDAGYADRLFCRGLSKPALDQDISVVLTQSDLAQVVYSGRLTIPSAMFATQVPDFYTYNSCAERGQNVSCETECRIAPDGNPCIVSTCTDACGAYFAVDTCPLMSMDFSSCSAEQWQQMKARYSIP